VPPSALSPLDAQRDVGQSGVAPRFRSTIISLSNPLTRGSNPLTFLPAGLDHSAVEEVADVSSVEKRSEEILELLQTHSRVHVSDLAARFQVSPVTVRADLAMLEQRGDLRRVRGGAVLPDSSAREGSFDVRLRASVTVKRALARAAAELVSDGDAIALDSSTTAYYVAEALYDRRGLTVVTNGLRVAELLAARPGTTVVMPGGVVRPLSQSLVGDFGDFISTRGRLRLGIFGARAVSAALGYLEVSPDEAAVKRAFVSACDQVAVVFESAKTASFGLVSFIPPDVECTAVTDDAAAPAFVQALRDAHQNVVLVPVPADSLTA
jgi:DeoR/GlpR family transcriptional regulator of sugar metabolism